MFAKAWAPWEIQEGYGIVDVGGQSKDDVKIYAGTNISSMGFAFRGPHPTLTIRPVFLGRKGEEDIPRSHGGGTISPLTNTLRNRSSGDPGSANLWTSSPVTSLVKLQMCSSNLSLSVLGIRMDVVLRR